ncbi:M48 family metalloprotease [Rufibacter roseus]|uniref:M48 family metalloprotease n=1 Tax=Rufibacter roseus TaxID=1567108 RepID=A0ABW2DI68_9BACT|nr:M48 family metallopeptidase [Rufibacter roseus]
MKRTFPYPAMPQGVDERIIAPSAAFKREVAKVAAAIAFFAVVYVALMAAALALAVLCGLGGYFLVVLKPAFFTFMLGLGLAGLGLMVIFFLLKFMFKRSKTDRSDMVEIQEEEQPELFAFIRNITQETQTPFPKKIYLSAEVNAAVFYDSSFWSMFLPVKKNLVIGLGLVNSVNVTEFKAILAHEFGHFSQRSMKLGSYVYNVNRAIYNMLYDNQGYGKALEKWADISGYFALFAGLTAKIVQAIQWVLKKAYVVVNKPYMCLSRQMEFHADSVAAYVTGSEPLITSLRRIEAADACYSRLFNHYNAWLSENLKADNMYPQHRALMHLFSEDFHIPMAHGLLQVNAQTLSMFNQSRLMMKDQWASHPSTDDRAAHLLSLNIPAEVLHDSPWVLFRKVEQVQQLMTQKVYEKAEFAQAPQALSLPAFSQKLASEMQERSFDKAYKGFYDNRNIKTFDVETVAATAELLPAITFDDLFTDANCKLPQKISSLEADLETVQQIVQGAIDIKSFDFDGRKYSAKDAVAVQQILENEIKEAQEQLDLLDQKAFGFFYQKAHEQDRTAALVAAYQSVFTATKEAEEDTQLFTALWDTLHFIFNNEMTLEGAKTVCQELEGRETPVKKRLQHLLQDELYTRCITPHQLPKLEKLASQTRVYVTEYGFDSVSLDELAEGSHLFVQMSWEKVFHLKKETLALQMAVVQQQQEENLTMEEV